MPTSPIATAVSSVGRTGLYGGDPLIAQAAGGQAQPGDAFRDQETGSWFPLLESTDDFTPTIIDCSRWVEAPTGRHGFLQVRGEQFVFEDGKPIRFWGSHLEPYVHAQPFQKSQFEFVARRLRKLGYNVVRLGPRPLVWDANGKTYFDYSKEGFDHLDYLIYTLGQYGIYVILTNDYPVVATIKPDDHIPGFEQPGAAARIQFFDAKVAALRQKRILDIMTHFNPYSKMRYADDPTIALVEILNEDSLFWPGDKIPEPFQSELRQQFREWLGRRYATPPAEPVELLPTSAFQPSFGAGEPAVRQRAIDQLRFYYELENNFWQSTRELMRKAGVKVPISGSNWQGAGFTTRIHLFDQAKLDYIDRHGYWDHPQGRLTVVHGPSLGDDRNHIDTERFYNLPMVRCLSGRDHGVANLVISKAWERVFGLPLDVSEWDTCSPNEYSLEGTGLMAAYGLLQGWGGNLQFAYTSPDWLGRLGDSPFDILNNPPQILQFPAAATMWHRGDVREADVVAESLYTPESIFEFAGDRTPAPLTAALVGKVGYRFVEHEQQPTVKDIRPFWDPKTLVARSETGELAWDARLGVVTVDTPRSQAVIGFLSTEPQHTKLLEFRSETKFGALWVTAMDGDRPIQEARRLLVTAVGPARNTGMEYERTDTVSPQTGWNFWRLKTMGTGPVVMQAVVGQVSIRSEHAGRFRGWLLNVNGKRVRQIDVRSTASRIELDLLADSAFYYELEAGE